MTEPRDLADLVPTDVRVELAAVVAALELHGPAVTNALRRLDRATAAARNAVTPVNQGAWPVVESMWPGGAEADSERPPGGHPGRRHRSLTAALGNARPLL